MGQRLEAIPLRDLLLEEKRQPREAKQEEKYCTDRADPAVQTIEKQHEKESFLAKRSCVGWPHVGSG